MARIVHPILGSLDLSEPGDWEAEVTFGGHPITFDLTIEEPGVTALDLSDLPGGRRLRRAAALIPAHPQRPRGKFRA